MRILFGLAMVVTGTALSGCVSSTFDSLSGLNTGCTTSVTAVNCTGPTPTTTSPATTTTSTGSGTTTAPTQNTGNTTGLSTGDTTIALEGSSAITSNTNPALSKLAFAPTNTPGTSNQQIWFDTKTASNGNWPISKLMTYSDYGTCVNDGGADALNPGLCKNGTGGHGLAAITSFTAITRRAAMTKSFRFGPGATPTPPNTVT